MAGEDVRRDFVLMTVANYFGLAAQHTGVQRLSTSRALARFLDDPDSLVLAARRSGDEMALSDTVDMKLDAVESQQQRQVLVFFKLRAAALSADNVHSCVLVSSLADSPVLALYHAVRYVYAPLLTKDDGDPKLQSLLSELESGLGRALRQQSDPTGRRGRSKAQVESDLCGILSPCDEFEFWAELAARGGEGAPRASFFHLMFEPLTKDFATLHSLTLDEVAEVLEVTREILEDVWRQTEHEAYPQQRMENLLHLIGASLARHVSHALAGVPPWVAPFSEVREALSAAASLCQRWTDTCEQLTGATWSRFTPHAWRGGAVNTDAVQGLASRLRQVLSLRTAHEQLLALLSSSERDTVQPSKAFKPFEGLNPLHYNPYTQPLWQAAVLQYERVVEPAESRVAAKLRSRLMQTQGNPAQLLQEFHRYRELLCRPHISQELLSERETLLAQLTEYNKSVWADFNKRSHGVPGESTGPPAGKNLSEVVNNIVWVQQLEAKMRETLDTATVLLGSLSGFAAFRTDSLALQEELSLYRREHFEGWSRDTLAAIADPDAGVGLRASGRVMQLEPRDGSLRVCYSDHLAALIAEVRQLSALGYTIPPKVLQAATTALKFYRHANTLKQVAHFYNTIDQQMIPSQRPMLLEAALAFEKIIKKSGSRAEGGSTVQVTWDSPEQLESYIAELQRAAETLTGQNRRLRRTHLDLCDKVVALMSVDLLRQQQRWKSAVQEIRQITENVAAQGGVRVDNMAPWLLHWDHQLYKALELQYQAGLERLHLHLPDIHTELTFTQGRLQLRPPIEELRSRYYREVRRFLGAPAAFLGVRGITGPTAIFPAMVERNEMRFLAVYMRAEALFARLADACTTFQEWVVLGQVDVEALIEKHLHTVADWERNFRSLKTRGKDAERLPTQLKVDCIVVNCGPVRTSIDTHIQQLFEGLLHSLRGSIQAHVQEMEAFISEGSRSLSTQPQTVEEIGDARRQHADLVARTPQLEPLFMEMEAKNRLLRSVGGAGVERLSVLRGEWDGFQLRLHNHELVLKEQVDRMRGAVMARVTSIARDVERFHARWMQLRPNASALESSDRGAGLRCLESLREQRSELHELLATRAVLVSDCHHFDVEEPNSELIDEVTADVAQYEAMWGQYEEFVTALSDMEKEDWISFRSRCHVFEEFLLTWHERLRKAAPTPVMIRLQSDVDRYRLVVPVLKFVRGEHLSADHWLELFRLLALPRGTTLERLTFSHILNSTDVILQHATELKELNSRAQGEVSVREALRELELWGASAAFSLAEHTEVEGGSVPIVCEWRDLLGQLADQRSLLQSLRDSPYYRGFEDKVQVWESRLSDLDESLHNLNLIQRKWLYLEPIFGRGALPREHARFLRVHNDFCDIMREVSRDMRLLTLVARPGIKRTLSAMLDQLQRCQKALNDFLEEKRSTFPRFYFIGDDDLLEILGQATNPTVIQAHLKKLFAGIHSVEFDDGCHHIMAMRSLDGELVPLRQQVEVTADVEVWLGMLAEEMRQTLKQLLVQCLKNGKSGDIDPSQYPSQVLCLAERVRFTGDVERALPALGLSQLEVELREKIQAYTRFTGTHTDPVLALKLKALVLDAVHALDVVRALNTAGARDIHHWDWQRQLRFYIRSDGTCVARMVDAEFLYTYEYQGNAQQLVHTPLTDKCYLTLTQGMRMGLGGNPYGPAGTGKTESVKALGGLFGRQVLVFNCDEGIDVRAIGRIFVGLVKCGAWGCFDEFNRLEETVLSAVSTQIHTIQDALKCRAHSCTLLGSQVVLDHNSGIFITLNPAGKGYGGRQKLPDNLKQLFRPVAMTRPDNELIAAVILHSEGFTDAHALGAKLCAIFSLAKEVLSPQQHYDWGLRALKTVLRGCGSLLQSSRQEGADKKIDESGLVVRALRVNTLSKLAFADVALFDALVRDVFPGTDLGGVEHGELHNALLEACTHAGLAVVDAQVRKALELHEQLRQRTGVVVVGPSGAGKSTLWSLLRMALARLGRTVVQHTLNPKALPRAQLLGHLDMDTREWTDGVLTASARAVVRQPQDVQSWVVCDGDVDPEWIESLNSVLDDNRLLTMPSGERIQFGPNVNFIFETHDLSSASPATVSRMGMIFLSDEDTDVRALVGSWLSRQDEAVRDDLGELINEHFYRALSWVTKQSEQVVPCSLVGVVMSGLSHLHSCSHRTHFAVGLVRGLGANLPPRTRLDFAKEVFGWVGESLPDPRRPLDVFVSSPASSEPPRLCCYDSDTASAVANATATATDAEEAWGPPPVVLTAHARRALDTFGPWLDERHPQPFLLVGPEGCGKSTLLRQAFSRLRSVRVATVHCSAQTAPHHVLQTLAQACALVSSGSGRALRPRDCERLVLHLKDVNLPRPDKWGTSQLSAFLQQVLTYRGFYDEALEWVGLEGVQVVASMTAGGSSGRHPLSPRLSSILRIACIDYPEAEELQAVCCAYLGSVLHAVAPAHPLWVATASVKKLAGSMLTLYQQVRAKFTPDDHNHYLFTPRNLTQWALGLLRYDPSSGDRASSSADAVLEVWAYESCREFRDRLVGSRARDTFDAALASVLHSDWGSNPLPQLADAYYVTWGAHHMSVSAPGQPLPQHGKPLGRLSSTDLKSVIKKGLVHFAREYRPLRLLLFPELLAAVARAERVLSRPGGSLLLAGPSGVGRRTAATLAASMHGLSLLSPRVSRTYGSKQFRGDVKGLMQQAGVEGLQVGLLLEDFQMLSPEFLEIVNSLLSSGEVPGLFSPEELEPLLAPLRESASQDGFTGPIYNYFTRRVQQNLHVVLVMDYTHPDFTLKCDSNPALVKRCTVLWMDGWSKQTMLKIPEMMLSEEEEVGSEEKTKERLGKLPGGAELIRAFLHVHESCAALGATPRRYLAFVQRYQHVLTHTSTALIHRKGHLQAGVSKLTEARTLVDELKGRAAEQSTLLAEKRADADQALRDITTSMQNVSVQKAEMERLQETILQEAVLIEQRKCAIDLELAEVQPLVDEAKQAVGSIRPESLSEIRSLRMPPDIIRDILEGVLRLMGTFDTSWVSMKSFLARRGVRDDIVTFDSRSITREIRDSVEELLMRNATSFDPKNAKRASAVAAPLAAWVQANVKYSHVLDKIQPLESEQSELVRHLQKTESKKKKLETELNSVDQRVAELKEKFASRTSEAAVLEHELLRAQETIAAAESLVGQLEGEFMRWTNQVSEISSELDSLPTRSLLAAAFITYLSSAPEDQRRMSMSTWAARLGLQDFNLLRFLSTESQQLQWKSEGLPTDELCMENALVTLQSGICPFLIDPSSRAIEWLKTHLKDTRLEVINQQDVNFMTSLELAVRFGKTLIIQEVENIEPVLYPLLRGDLIAQGSRFVVQLGERQVDHSDEFRLFLATRSPRPDVPPDAASALTAVNFTTTRAGLTAQLLALTLQHEKPELETRKTELLCQEEEKKIQLALLEDSLLESLATARGNVLENRALIDSLNQTKASSSVIANALNAALQLQGALNQERDAFLPLAEKGSSMFFIMADLCKINHMYRYSLNGFLRLFQRALHATPVGESPEGRVQALIASLQRLVFESVSRSLFKADQLVFALHLVRGLHPELFQENEWELFTGLVVTDAGHKPDSHSGRGVLPSWVEPEHAGAFALLKATCPGLVSTLHLDNADLWAPFSRSTASESALPPALQNKISAFQQVLLIQALRPDRLVSATTLFATRALGVRDVSPLSLARISEQEAVSSEPLLVLTSPGADPSHELRELAASTHGTQALHEVAMGQGAADEAVRLLRDCAQAGTWLCLKNLHLVTAWLPTLEKELNSLSPHADFRLWLTSEPHTGFSPVLLQASLKIAYEAPPGLKRNLQRTYESWTAEQVSGSRGDGGGRTRAHALFSLAWFHAVCQERRNYIPQGWTQFYEFSLSDLRAGYDIIDRFCTGSSLPWEHVRGLLEGAVYGGRVDNAVDAQLLRSFLSRFFGPRAQGPAPPATADLAGYRALIEGLPEEGRPRDLGLPDNIERSAQRSVSTQVIGQLKAMMRPASVHTKFDREMWSHELSPVLNLWKKLNQGSQLIQPRGGEETLVQEAQARGPVAVFVAQESVGALRLVRRLHASLAALSKLLRGATPLSATTSDVASALLRQQCPSSWHTEWEGPIDPMLYLRFVVSRALALQGWLARAKSDSLMGSELDLSELFHPQSFLNALRQQTARELGCSMDSLHLVSSWTAPIPGARAQVQVGGLQLEGCTWGGAGLEESVRDSPSLCPLPACRLAWVPQDSPSIYRGGESVSLPVYTSVERDHIVTNVAVPCDGDIDKWIQCGAALFLRTQ
uniref:Cytoplasmic dynein 2 heavy chain 1 n=1 Tax=Petromyzon marinus TaxID=7757 RepID=A0AAJ7U9A9_PETMA|nr:cytoplasmic dynein 2 heavy chain 1 [Petromyzon marinus]XP_032832097.1 cytoplasmic dynein 2 heavy chain 1 [Petromyzon marinus]XP_032832104.1 cytoplasmic dynein 2 heavy chain 1 [Petromyzon marinus]